jgi:hypothetical protein
MVDREVGLLLAPEDPQRRGLLFAGTELGVFFSINDGDSWQPLRLNMPSSPVHDLVIKENDLVVASHGRAFWILDDISPLRQITNESNTVAAYLFQPSTAMRIRANTNHDTPLPPEEPAGENPPPGFTSVANATGTPASSIRVIEVCPSCRRTQSIGAPCSRAILAKL